MSYDCCSPRKDKDKGEGKNQANIVEEMEDADDLCAMISERNLVGNSKEWFLDSGDTQNILFAKESLQRTLLLSTMKICSCETERQQGL